MRRCGFTLIELLVAVFLLALLSVMAYRGIDAMARADDHLVGVSERWQAITLLFERFAADATQPSNRAVRDATGALLPQWWGRPFVESTNSDAQLEFTRKSQPGQDDVRVAYRLRANTVELLIWPVLDRVPASRAAVYPLLEGVNGMRFRYLDSQGRWQDSWPVTGVDDALPRAVSIELAFADQAPVYRVFALP
ncbi:MAG TPA: type II secretion system minor pseudopilin GspJ [Burkholderiales bacterium]|nr:type II secretion system minor pseudopilin GspJ [Burkholderiales bacterium]